MAGLSPVRLSTGTGLVCYLNGDHLSGAVLALRADLDALAIEDKKDVSYRSQVPGVTHPCAHDVHTTIMLGAALYFAHHLEELPGRLRLIFQPTEKRVPGGALDVLADNGLASVDSIIGIHCDPKLDVGCVGLLAGPISSAADMVWIVLDGPGGHTACPEEAVDMVSVAARVVLDLPKRVAAAADDKSLVKFVFGAARFGDAPNVIPSSPELRATIRTPNSHVWQEPPDLVEREVSDLLSGTGAGLELDYTSGVPPVVNDDDVVETVRRATISAFSKAAVRPAVQSWSGNDFAWFLRKVPGTYIRLGVHDPRNGHDHLDLHAGRFDVDERSIGVGVTLLVAIVHAFFCA